MTRFLDLDLDNYYKITEKEGFSTVCPPVSQTF